MSWNEPNNPGPPITGYDIRYRKGSSGSYDDDCMTSTGTKTSIAPDNDANTTDVDKRLSPNTSYEVHVKAKTDGARQRVVRTGHRQNERSATGMPIFDDRPDQEAAKTNRTIERTVSENTRARAELSEQRSQGPRHWRHSDLQAGRRRCGLTER